MPLGPGRREAMSRDIRLHYERVVGVALVLGATLPLYFLLTGFAVTGPSGSPLSCGTTVAELGRDRSTAKDPGGACHAGAVERLHVAGGYFAASLAVALSVWLVAERRERWLNAAWARGQVPSGWFVTPGQVWILAGLLFVLFISIARSGP
jgi:hypothetical protein